MNSTYTLRIPNANSAREKMGFVRKLCRNQCEPEQIRRVVSLCFLTLRGMELYRVRPQKRPIPSREIVGSNRVLRPLMIQGRAQAPGLLSWNMNTWRAGVWARIRLVRGVIRSAAQLGDLCRQHGGQAKERRSSQQRETESRLPGRSTDLSWIRRRFGLPENASGRGWLTHR